MLICGCISHLTRSDKAYPEQLAWFVDLYMGGISGTTGGVLCGSIATLFYWLLSDFMSYFVLTIAGIFALLGGMQITIPSIIRAVRNRPRADWEDEELEEVEEPAAVVVNHFFCHH